MSGRKVPGISTLRTLTQSAKSHRTEWHYRIHRKISIYVTWLLLHAPLSANQVSVLSLVVGFGAAAVVLRGEAPLALVGLACFYAYFLLDKVDGEIARFRGERSLRGICLDYVGHMVVPPLVPLSMGGFLAAQSGMGRFWLAGGLGALSVMFTRAARDIPASMVLHKTATESDLFARVAGRDAAGPAPRMSSRGAALSLAVRLVQWLASFFPSLFLLACALALYAAREELRAVLDVTFLALCALQVLYAAATGIQVARSIDRRVQDCMSRTEGIQEDRERES